MKSYAEKCVERDCELADKSVDQLFQVSALCMDDQKFTKDDFEIVADVCAQMVLTCVYLARISRGDIFWTVTALTRAVTRRNRCTSVQNSSFPGAFTDIHSGSGS